MESRSRNIFLSILFFAFIIALIVGGYIYTKDLMTSNKKTSKNNESEEIDYRIDKDKDYIYFENEEVVSDEPDITLKDAVLNIEGADIINSTLKSEMDDIKNQVVYLNETNTDSTKEKVYENSNIYSAVEREYYTYKTNEYFSLFIKDLDFNCYTDFVIKGIKSYVIDLKNSKIITNEELLNKYNLTMDDIKNKISSHLDVTQSIVDDKEVIRKDDTLNHVSDEYALYVDGNSLYVSYIVKTNFVDYNESISVN